MTDLSPCDELLQDRDQIRDALLTAFHDVITRTTAFDSDEMAARTLLDVIAYVLSFKVPPEMLRDPAEIGPFTRSETLRFEMYLREHLLRRRSESEALTTVADGEDFPTQPEDVLAEPSKNLPAPPSDGVFAEAAQDFPGEAEPDEVSYGY